MATAHPSKRATTDIDAAVLVADWGEFNEVQAALVGYGYKKSNAAQRLYSPADTPVDIVPFGAVADASSIILWPPAGDISMSVLGFQEAHAPRGAHLAEANGLAGSIT